MLIQHATLRGRSLAFNGVCGNLGAALAAGATAAFVAGLGWRAAFLVPGVICVISAVLYLRYVPDEARKAASRGTVADVPLRAALAATIFGLFVVIALCAGLVFNIVSVVLLTLEDKRLGSEVPLFLGVLWAAQANGKMLIVALAVTMAAIYAQVTVNDLVIARYTADAWRGRVYAV